MLPTNPYKGIATSDPANKHRLNLDVDHRDVVTINSVLMQHGALQNILNNIVKSYATYITKHSLTFTDREHFISRCTSTWSIGQEPSRIPIGGGDSTVHSDGPCEIRCDGSDSSGVQATGEKVRATRKGKSARRVA